ncbi:MAG: GNAT family N-acetyltransferase [Runella sp.]
MENTVIINAPMLEFLPSTSATFLEGWSMLVFENEPHAIERFRVRWPVWLFNTSTHVVGQNAPCVYTFVLTDTLHRELYAFFHLFVFDSPLRGRSPYRASFGSFEVVEHLSHRVFGEWLQGIEKFVKIQQISSLEIVHYPQCYAPAQSAFIKRGLLRQGFIIEKNFENHYFNVNQQPYVQHLHPSERRRLRKCQRAGFCFEEWFSPNPEEVFAFIEQNRKALGYKLSFDLGQLKQWLYIFPEQFKVFAVKDDDTIVSLALVVRVGPRVLYNFCPADRLLYRSFSPTVMLHEGLYQYCQKENISILDLGISVNAYGQPKQSLMRFKSKLGAVICPKMTFAKTLV